MFRLPEYALSQRTRRAILGRMARWAAGLGFAVLGLVSALWSVATARFLVPNVTTQPASRFKAGLPSRYPPGHVEQRYREQYGVWIVHGEYQGQQQLFALSTVCTHLGCITMWQESERRLKCPCHGSSFHPNGINFEGPAPRPLPRYAIRIADDGQIEVDRSRTFRQELGQWDDPASYI
ncbi:MAG: ubiquinol-cytochrome c reductase iron-sulfur subunit [Thermoguttaceae bacterium]|nr:ubiquinol-cytochrome c reductase iron-sulfur subunit [Thermoguttaceae bacterium]